MTHTFGIIPHCTYFVLSGGSQEDLSSYSYDHRETDEKIFEVINKTDTDVWCDDDYDCDDDSSSYDSYSSDDDVMMIMMMMIDNDDEVMMMIMMMMILICCIDVSSS